MFNARKITIAAAVLALLAAGSLGARTLGERVEERFDRTEALPRDGRVVLKNVSGDIQVATWSQEQVKIEALKTSEADSEKDAKDNAAEVTIEVTREGNTLRIETRYPRRGFWGRHNTNVSVDYKLTVPDKASIDLDSVSGDITADAVGGAFKAHSVSGNVDSKGAAGSVDVDTVSGDVTVTKSGADAFLKSVSGNIEISEVHGSVEAESVSGDLKLLGVSGAKDVKSNTVSGNVEYRGDVPAAGSFRMESHSGDIRLTVPADSAFDFEANTFSGTIDSDFPIQMSGRVNPRELRGTVGKGGAMLRLSTFSGNIEVKKG